MTSSLIKSVEITKRKRLDTYLKPSIRHNEITTHLKYKVPFRVFGVPIFYYWKTIEKKTSYQNGLINQHVNMQERYLLGFTERARMHKRLSIESDKLFKTIKQKI